MNLYSIRDNLTGFTDPTTMENDSIAKASFFSLIGQIDKLSPGSVPSDFSLYRLGTFDLENGVVKALKTPVFICRGHMSDLLKGDNDDAEKMPGED